MGRRELLIAGLLIAVLIARGSSLRAHLRGVRFDYILFHYIFRVNFLGTSMGQQTMQTAADQHATPTRRYTSIGLFVESG